MEEGKVVNYRLKLPQHLSRLYPVFHAKLLRKYNASATDTFPLPRTTVKDPRVEPDTDDLFDIERVLQRRTTTTNGRRHSEFLIKWKGYDDCDNTWEPASNIPAAFANEVQRLRTQ